MIKRIAKHFPHYFSLIGILVVGAAGFWFFSYDRLFQAAVAVAIAISYVVWGLVHHSIHKDLEAAIIVEYILVATLGLVVVFSLIFNA